MKFKILLTFLFIFTFLFFGFTSLKKIDYRKGKNNNVCKVLKNDVLVYVIFVDSKHTSLWTDFDIQTTLDSIKVAANWIKSKAEENNVTVNFVTDYYLGKEFITVNRALPNETVKGTLTQNALHEGFALLNKWADFIAKKAGEAFDPEQNEGIPEVKNPKNKERLIAYLRNKHNVESVALLFMVNNYFKVDISIPVNTLHDDDVEFAVVSYKYPSIIAHNILHLFGASDLFETPLRTDGKNIEMAKQFFPNDIMQDVYARNINTLQIGEYSRFLIGWNDDLDEKYHELLFDKRLKIK